MRAVVTGINGQDGILLSKVLRNNGYTVFGVCRPDSHDSRTNNDVSQVTGLDLSIPSVAFDYFNSVNPDLIFHFAAVHASSSQMNKAEKQFSHLMQSCHVEITRNILEWQMRNPKSKSIIALSSQMFKKTETFNSVIDENSEPDPTNVYGVTKAQAWNLLKKYRNEFGIRSSGVILFNHASIYSKPEFLFSELANKIVASKLGNRSKITVRNPNAFIDITSADEICNAVYSITQQDFLQDFVLGSGKSQSITDILREFSISQDESLEFESSELYSPDFCLVSSIYKAKMFLDWEPKKSPAELLAELVENRR